MSAQYIGRHRAPRTTNRHSSSLLASAALAAGLGIGANAASGSSAQAAPVQTSAVQITPQHSKAPTRSVPRNALVAAPGMTYSSPTFGTQVSSKFGPRWGRMHKGVDFAGSIGTPVRAAAAGRVVVASELSGYGNVVYIEHADGTQTRYAHLDEFGVRVGDRVVASEMIGTLGNTGRSTGPHLHFEVRVDGTAIDPLPWLRARGAH